MAVQTEGRLFEAVQLGHFFDDSKTFVDSVARFSDAEILARYDDALASGARFDLRALLDEWFHFPERVRVEPVRAGDIGGYIAATWGRLTRSAIEVPVGTTLLALPNPFLVPGGRFDECFYWDSYFTALGLLRGSPGSTSALQANKDLVIGIVDNLVHLQKTLGLIPNGSRSYFSNRSQPPVLALLVAMLDDPTPYLEALIEEHRYWTNPQRVTVVEGVPLARYCGGATTPRPESFAEDVATNGGSTAACALFAHLRAAAESGWDFSSRWMDDPALLATTRTEDVVPIDLNCLLVLLEHTIAAVGDRAGRKDLRQYRQMAIRRGDVLRDRCFDDERGWYCDLEVSTLQRRPQLSLAGVLPLVASVADDVQAARIVETLNSRFLAAGGLRTTLVDTDQQWDGRNGWAPLHWWAVEGLRAYGYADEAALIRNRWLLTCERGYANDRVLMEKYDVEAPGHKAQGGEYEVVEGFGWTNGVYVALSVQNGQVQ